MDRLDQAGAGIAAAEEQRRQIAARLAGRADVVVADTVATFPLTAGARRLDADYCVRLGSHTVKLLTEAVLDGRAEPRAQGIADLAAIVEERELTPDQLFTFVYLAMSTAIDELAHEGQTGSGAESWPQVSQIVRRAAFDLLAAWTTKRLDQPQRHAIEDALTTLHTRPVLDAVLAKECHRVERFEHWLSLLLIDLDNLGELNRRHGFGVGDRVLERLGILLRTWFREHDWVVRYREDTVAVLLPETAPDDAIGLAERTRSMVEDRLGFRDHRTDQRAVVTVSIGVVSARALQGEPIDEARLKGEAESVLQRAKDKGRNRVERVEMLPRLMSLEEAAVVLDTTLEGLERLVAEGRMEPITAGRHVRLERAAVERLAAGGR